MPRAATWAAALGGSLALHAGAVALILPALEPEPVPDQPRQRSSMALETVEAPTTEAAAQAPRADPAAEAEAAAASLNAAAVPQSRAQPLAAPVENAAAVASPGTPLPATAAMPETAVATAASADTLAATAPPSASAAPAAVPAQSIPTDTPAATRLSADAPQAVTAASVQAAAARLAATTPVVAALPALPAQAAPAPTVATVSEPAAPATATADRLAPGVPPASAMAAASPEGDELPETQASGLATTAPGAPLPEARATATLAWRFGDRLVTDPQALATIQAFMAPQALEGAAEVRDDLASVLTGIDCARVSATFLPESGALELRGHVPDPALTQPLLDALRGQVGEGIPIRANLLHLPAPQCGALAGMAATGLPQSTDQFTNPLLIGATAQARDFSYTEGQRLQFDMTAPDYDAFVYVDYFAADGSVIHLVPNEVIPLTRHTAKSVVPVGGDLAGRAGLRITIGPPFGQEIAVAFAASVPLYEGLRPISEPAAPYLDVLTERIAAARAADPAFKGEWVYFFITTAPASQ
jgi:hypothetical protein